MSPRSSWQVPPRTGNEEKDDYNLELHHRVFGIGTDVTGDLDADNLAGTFAVPFSDDTDIIKGSDDATKILKFEVDGFATSTTNTLTPQDKSYTIADNADIPTSIADLTTKDHDLLDGLTDDDHTQYFKADGTRALSGPLELSGDITPAQITGQEDDYNPTGLSGASTLRLASDASQDITGLAGGADGRVLLIHNIDANDIVLKDEDVNSTASNRFALNTDVTIETDNLVVLQYDSTSSRWRVVAGGGGGGGDLLADGTVPLTANWDAGAFEIRAETLESDVATGTAPLTIASTTVVANLNVDQVDGKDETAFALLAGRSGGQTFNLGLDSGDTGTIHTTAHATKAVLNICDTAYVDEVNNYFGVNTPAPESDFHLTGTTLVANVGDFTATKEAYWFLQFSDVHSSGHAAHAPTFLLRRTRGTKASPTTVANGDQIGAFGFRGYDGTAYRQTVLVGALVDGAVSTNVVPTRLDFNTGVTTNSPLRMRIQSNGLMGLGGVTTALAQVHIDQSSTTAAIPTLIVDQADISEGTINFIASARGTGSTAASDIQDTVRVELNGTVYRLALYTDA